MLPNNFANVPENVRKNIEQAAVKLYLEGMKAEADKTAVQREAETLYGELETLGTTMKGQYLKPSQYAQELAAGEKRVSEISARLQAIGAEKPSQGVGDLYMQMATQQPGEVTFFGGQLFDASGKKVTGGE